MPSITLGAFEIRYTGIGQGDTLLLLADNLHAAQAYKQEIAGNAQRLQERRVRAFEDGTWIETLSAESVNGD